MTNPRFLLLTCSLFLVYTQGLWERIFNFSPAIGFIIESLIWSYLLLSIKLFRKHTPGYILILVYISYSFITLFINESGTLAWLKYSRYFLYFYLIYLTLFHSRFSKWQWELIFKIIIFLTIIQGLGSIYTVVVLNKRIEGYVGLMSTLGGTTAATFPLLIISISVLLFLFNIKHNTKLNLILLFCGISAVLVGYSSGKRAVFFSIPLFISFIFLISLLRFIKSISFYKRLAGLTIIILLFIPYFFWGIKTTGGINYNLTGNETKIEIFKNALEYARYYERALSPEGRTGGRSASTTQVLNQSTKNSSLFLFGNGYGTIKDETVKNKLGIIYGIVGITRDIISGGWIVMVLTVLIIMKIILTNESLDSGVTKAIRILILAVFIFTHFGYSSDFTVSLKINYFLLILLAFINSPTHKEHLETILIKYFHKDDIVQDSSNIIVDGSDV